MYNGINGTARDGFLPPPKSFATKAIHTAQEPENWKSLAISPPLVMSSTFKMYTPGIVEKYEYSRIKNPTRDVLESCLAALEGGKHGLCYSSGMTAALGVLGLLKCGQGVLSSKDVYGGTCKLFSKVAPSMGIEVQFADFTDLETIEEMITDKIKIVWIETPTNPLLTVIDVRKVARLTKKHGVLLVVDNTFLTPYFQRPIELGADIVVHSLTKYINGHADVIMGAVIVRDDDVHEKLRDLQGATGIVPSPYDCNCVNRSLKTLEIRMKQHSVNGLVVAKFLERHPMVEKVLHPGLPSHPQHNIFKSQTSGHSGMITFYIKGGRNEVFRFLDALKLFILAESMGGYDSLVNYPPLMTHGMIPESDRIKMNITDNVIRLSVGLENVEDLVEDLSQAFDCCISKEKTNGTMVSKSVI